MSTHFHPLPQGVCLGFLPSLLASHNLNLDHSPQPCWMSLLTYSCSFRKGSAGKGEVTFMRPLCVLQVMPKKVGLGCLVNPSLSLAQLPRSWINSSVGDNGPYLDFKMLHSVCHQICKTQQWPQDWKRSVFIPVSKRGNAKECSNYHTVALISQGNAQNLSS